MDDLKQSQKSGLRVCYLTSADPENKKSWSGLHFMMLQSLRTEFEEVVPFGPVRNLHLKLLLYFIDYILLFFTGKRLNRVHNRLAGRFYASIFKKRLERGAFDVIFAPAASTEISFLSTDIPVCLLVDTTFGQINEYYGYFSNFTERSVTVSNTIEQRALDLAKTIVFSSDWAADFSVKHYNQFRKKISIVKFGANIEGIPASSGLHHLPNTRTCHLLFIGVDWYRKGGSIAFETLLLLLEKGYDATLTVIGCQPPVKYEKMHVVPFLDKNRRDDMEKMRQVYMESDLFLFPTRADCTPVVICEANAFGLPVITTDTGGVTSLVEDGVNGMVLPFESVAADYTSVIISILEDPALYVRLSKGSREKYEKELNWSAWGKRMREILIHTSGLVHNA